MPTVHKLGALRFVIYPNDHRPAHVHVIGGGQAAVFNLRCPGGPPELRENFGFSQAKLNRISPWQCRADPALGVRRPGQPRK